MSLGRTAIWVFVACGLVAHQGHGDYGVEPVVFSEALFAYVGDEDTGLPPGGAAAWQRVSLPDRWPASRPGLGGFGWYRFFVAGPRAADERVGLLLERVNMNAEAFANGVPVGSGGRMQRPVARNSNRPLYWVIPGALLDREHNAIDVRMYAYANDLGTLGRVRVGPDALLRPAHARQLFLQVELAQVGTGLALLTALFFAVLWVNTGRVPAYGWLAVSAAAWSVVSINYWAQNVGMSHWNWVRVFFLALGLFITTIPVWAHRLVEIRRPGIERVFLAALALYVALAVALSDEGFSEIIAPVRMVLLAIAAYGVGFLIRARASFAHWEARAYAAGGILAIALAASDVLRAVGFIDASWPEMFPYVGLVLVICFATTLGVRFSSALREARRLNTDLEERVRVKTRELEDRHERVRELERVQVLAAERERLVREMHDGLGGQLVATLALVKSGGSRTDDVADALRNALDDMRAVIDSMDPLVDDLGKLFGGFRARFESLLQRNGLRCTWRVGELPATPWLGAEQYLHILRILQEAVANAIKHAEASELEVTVDPVGDPEASLLICVRDNGCGFGPGASRGRGLAHMHGRAEALGARLVIEPADPGTRVAIRLPLSPSPATAP